MPMKHLIMMSAGMCNWGLWHKNGICSDFFWGTKCF